MAHFQVPPASSRTWVARHRILAAALGVVALLSVIGIAAATRGDTHARTGSTQSAKGQAAPSPRTGGSTPTAASGIGRAFRDGTFQFTVTKVTPGVAHVGDSTFGKTARGRFAFLYLTVKNVGGRARYFDEASQLLYDAAGHRYSADTAAAVYLDQAQSLLNSINPGSTANGLVVFDLPQGVRGVLAELHESSLSRGVKIGLG